MSDNKTDIIIKGYDGSRHASSSELASKNKKKGHKLEEVYANRVNGKVKLGQTKPDIIESNGETTSCKGAKKHIQILLQSKDKTIKKFGNNHPISKFVEAGYKVKKYKFENNNNINLAFKEEWKEKADNLAIWFSDKNNLKVILDYIFTKNGEVDNLVILENENADAYKFKIDDVVDFYSNLDYNVYVTNGCKVVVSSFIPKISENKKVVIFNFELRGSKGKIGSINYWNDAQRFYNSIKKNLEFELISNNKNQKYS